MRKQFRDLENDVIKWAKDKGILDKATPLTQFEKTDEEVGELEVALLAQSKGLDEFSYNKKRFKTDDAIKDAIGDIVVTLIIQAKMQGLDIEQCLQHAYKEIKDRTGVMKDGVFVKDK